MAFEVRFGGKPGSVDQDDQQGWFVFLNPSGKYRPVKRPTLAFRLEPWLLHLEGAKPGEALVDAGPLRLVPRRYLSKYSKGGFGLIGQIELSPEVWPSGLAGYRPELIAAFDAFSAELLELEGSRVAPGASGIILQQLATALPATFEESLYFAYGLYRTGGSAPRCRVDLKPGMRLRLDFAFSQFIPEAPEGLNGYVSAGSAYADVVEVPGSDGKPAVALDAFLGTNPVPRIPTAHGGISGLIDFRGADLSRRFLRLCYPTQLAASDSPGSASPAQNIAMLSADTPTALAKATEAYYSSGDPGDGVGLAFFRGRMTVVPEIPVFFNNTPIYVPLGTTVRQFVQRYATLPRVPNLPQKKFDYRRHVATANGAATGKFYSQVVFQNNERAAPFDGYDLPMLAADHYRFAALG